MLGRGHPSSACENVRILRDERMFRSDLEHHQIMVAESDLRSRWRRFRVYQGRIRHPCLTGSFEIFLHTSPLVPNKETIQSNKEESKDNKNDDSNLSCFLQVTSNVVNSGGVEVITEWKSILIWNGQKSRIESEVSKSIINVLFQKFKGSVDAGIILIVWAWRESLYIYKARNLQIIHFTLHISYRWDWRVKIRQGLLEWSRESEILKTVKTWDRNLRRSDVAKRINFVDPVNGICNNTVCVINTVLDTCR